MVHLRRHLFVLQTIIVFQRKSFNHIDFVFLRNCFLSCGSNTINHTSYEMCMRKIPCDKDSVSTLKSSNSVKFQFHMFSARAGVFSPGAGVFFLPEPEVKNLEEKACRKCRYKITAFIKKTKGCKMPTLAIYRTPINTTISSSASCTTSPTTTVLIRRPCVNCT